MKLKNEHKDGEKTYQLKAASKEAVSKGFSFEDNRNQSIQRKPNNTGIPDQLKDGIENLSGHSMDDVKVHYNSSKPEQLNAHAFAQGNQIHLASGQEKHLPHEAWHTVQQKQGRVQPTTQVNGSAINDNPALEKEADIMGEKAMQRKGNDNRGFIQSTSIIQNNSPVQKKVTQRSVESIFAILEEHVEINEALDEWKASKEEVIQAIKELKYDTMEPGELPIWYELYRLIGNHIEEKKAPKSPWTGKPYTNALYIAHRNKFSGDLGLDTDYTDMANDACIDHLFQKFISRPFKYTMQAGGIDIFAAKHGDCKTLATSFQLIVQQEFGVHLDIGVEHRSFLAPSKTTIDSNAKGNCDNGSKWFFNNHYWIQGGAIFDLLFKSKNLNNGAWDLEIKTGHFVNKVGKYYETASGIIVYDNVGHQKNGPYPTNFLTAKREELAEAGYVLDDVPQSGREKELRIVHLQNTVDSNNSEIDQLLRQIKDKTNNNKDWIRVQELQSENIKYTDAMGKLREN